MRAEREKRAAVLTAEGVRQSQDPDRRRREQTASSRAEGERQGQILRAEGQAQAIGTVFQAVHDGDADPKVRRTSTRRRCRSWRRPKGTRSGSSRVR